MKRISAFIVAFAMLLTLAACGGNTDQASSANTPPATQEETPQPDSTPTDNAQPSESADTPPEEPQNELDTIPEGAVLLYDGVHYIIPTENIYTDHPSVVISGETSQKDMAEFTHLNQKIVPAVGVVDELACTTTITFGDDSRPLNELVEFEVFDDDELDECTSSTEALNRQMDNTIPPDCFMECKIYGNITAYVVNSTDAERPARECPVGMMYALNTSSHIYTKIDGQDIATMDDLVNLYGAPTAAFLENGDPFYIWLFNDFFFMTTVYDGELSSMFYVSLFDGAETIFANFYSTVDAAFEVLADLNLR